MSSVNYHNLGGEVIISRDPLVSALIYREIIKLRPLEEQPDIVLYSPHYSGHICLNPADFGEMRFIDKIQGNHKKPVTLGEKGHLPLKPATENGAEIKLADAFLVADATRVADCFSANAVFPEMEPDTLRSRNWVAAPILLPLHTENLVPLTPQFISPVRTEIERDFQSNLLPEEKSESYKTVLAEARKWAEWILSVEDAKRSVSDVAKHAEVLAYKKFYSIPPSLPRNEKNLLLARKQATYNYAFSMPYYLHQTLNTALRFSAGAIQIHGGIGPEAGLWTALSLLKELAGTPLDGKTSMLLASHGRTPNETDYLLTVPEHQDITDRRPFFEDSLGYLRPKGNTRPRNKDILPRPLFDSVDEFSGHNPDSRLPPNPVAFLRTTRSELASALMGYPTDHSSAIKKTHYGNIIRIMDLIAQGKDEDARFFINRLDEQGKEALIALIQEHTDAMVHSIMACNTAHIFEGNLSPFSRGMWHNLPLEGLKSIPPAEEGKKRRVLVLATPASHAIRLYHNALEKSNRKDIELVPITPDTLVDLYDIIFNKVSAQDYKAGAEKTLQLIDRYSAEMKEGDVIVMGCTEFSIPQVTTAIHTRFSERFHLVDNDQVTIKKIAQNMITDMEKYLRLQAHVLASIAPEQAKGRPR